MSSGQAWIVIAELAIFNAILATIVTLTLLSGLNKKDGKAAGERSS